MKPKEDFDFELSYRVVCDGCGLGTQSFSDEEKARRAAKKLGLVAVADVSGQMAFCKNCMPGGKR